MTSYTCDCIGTQYKGTTCQTGIISLPSLPILSVGQVSDQLWISAKPDVSLTITFTFPDGTLEVSPPQVTLTNSGTNTSFTIRPLQAGTIVMSYTLSGPSAAAYEDPRSMNVLVLASLPHSATIQLLQQHCRGTLLVLLIPWRAVLVHSLIPVQPPLPGLLPEQAVDGQVTKSGTHVSCSRTRCWDSMPLSIAGSELSLEPYVQNSQLSEAATCSNCGGK